MPTYVPIVIVVVIVLVMLSFAMRYIPLGLMITANSAGVSGVTPASLMGMRLRRVPQDRPKVIPDGAQNFAFLGQFTELPGDVVFTVEYSIHGAMHAVYEFFGVDRPIPPIYRGLHDPKVGFKALHAAFK